MSRARLGAVAIAAMCAASAAVPEHANAQGAAAVSAAGGLAPARSWREVVGGSELEEYLRALQLDTSATRTYPQGVRAMGPAEPARILRPGAAHPWAGRFGSGAPPRRPFGVLRPGVRLIGNTGFPFGMNDGPVWAGRGLTAAVDAGAYLAAGPLTVRVQPVLLWAQNARFRLFDGARSGDARYRNPTEPEFIDLPQRFGDGAVARLDFGQSEVRLDRWGATVGLSNASQSWGPATTHPLILGPNAPGFAHAFVGTSYPVPVGIGRLHARIVAGRLDETAWSPAPDSLARRLAAGMALTFAPRGVDGLELGATRFFHRRWTEGRIPWGAWRIPLTGLLLKSSSLDVDDVTSANFLPDNQLASLFARWAPPGAGVELYGEFARNDAAFDLREVITEPDHQSAYLLGFRARLPAPRGALRVLRAEWVNSRATHIDRVRAQSPFYSHGIFVQGHTNRGEALGSVAMQGGGGAVLGLDRYDGTGRRSWELHRIVRLAQRGEGAPSAADLDVQYAAGYERTRFVRGMDVTASATGVWELNRDFQRDAVNLRLGLGVRWGAPARPAAP